MALNGASFFMIVIGIKGLIGSGKSTVAKYLIERHGFTSGRWAGALKDMLRAYLRYRGCAPDIIERMINGDLKEIPTDWLGGKSPRHAMEGLGGVWGRGHMHDDFWIETETDKLWAEQPQRVVFEDCRYPNEADAIERMNGHVWHVYRPGQTPQDHPTEHAQKEIIPHHAIQNANGRLAETFIQVDSLINVMVARQARLEAGAL
jgi:hypothetical protein